LYGIVALACQLLEGCEAIIKVRFQGCNLSVQRLDIDLELKISSNQIFHLGFHLSVTLNFVEPKLSLNLV